MTQIQNIKKKGKTLIDPVPCSNDILNWKLSILHTRPKDIKVSYVF